MTWNHKKLQENIENLFGKEQLELLSPCLKTVEEKGFYVNYHCNEVERLINKELKEITPDNHKLLQLRLCEDSEDFKNVKLIRKRARAHIIACLQSLHSLSDVLAHAIYFALNMGNKTTTQIDASKINAYNVLKKLDFVEGADSLKIIFDSLANDDRFGYLSAIVNCSKHRNLINTSFWIDLDKNKEYSAKSFEFYAFEFKGKNYNQQRVIEFIKNEYSRIDNLVNEIGMEINKFVRNKLEEQSD